MTGSMTPFTGRSGNTPMSGQRIQYGTTTVAEIPAGTGTWIDVNVTFDEPFASPPWSGHSLPRATGARTRSWWPRRGSLRLGPRCVRSVPLPGRGSSSTGWRSASDTWQDREAVR